jgi:hypothetical protein
MDEVSAARAEGSCSLGHPASAEFGGNYVIGAADAPFDDLPTRARDARLARSARVETF